MIYRSHAHTIKLNSVAYFPPIGQLQDIGMEYLGKFLPTRRCNKPFADIFDRFTNVLRQILSLDHGFRHFKRFHHTLGAHLRNL